MDTIITKLLIEVVILKRILIFSLILFFSVSLYNQNCTADAITGLNNETLSSDTAIKEGNVVMIPYFDSVSDKNHNNTEIYNIGKLDNFIKNIKKGKKDKVRIVEYARNKTGTWVNKLFDLEYDGNKIADTEYDTYSNPNAFIPSQKVYSDFMEKRDYTDNLWYGLGTGHTNGKSCCPLISFPKSSIVN
jgi:hypothetical protein